MKRKNIKEKIRDYFFLNPTIKLRVRQIERELSLPLPSVIRYVGELEKEGILKKVVVGNVVFYSADRISKHFILEKKLSNIRQLHEKGLISSLKQHLANPVIIVFGSYSKGEDMEKSDIDLYLETPSKKQITLKEYEKKLERGIQFFVHKDLNEIKNKELKNNILNGVKLNGFIEVFK